MHSPYYNDSHHRFRAAIRTFIDAEIRPTAVDDDLKGKAPSLELNMKLGDAGACGRAGGWACVYVVRTVVQLTC